VKDVTAKPTMQHMSITAFTWRGSVKFHYTYKPNWTFMCILLRLWQILVKLQVWHLISATTWSVHLFNSTSVVYSVLVLVAVITLVTFSSHCVINQVTDSWPHCVLEIKIWTRCRRRKKEWYIEYDSQTRRLCSIQNKEALEHKFCILIWMSIVCSMRNIN